MLTDWLTALSASAGSLKPVLPVLVLPPAPQIALTLLGAWRLRRQRRGGWALVLTAAALSWLCACQGFANALEQGLLRVPAELDAAARADLRARAAKGEAIAIVVLGGGIERDAPEYGGDDLAPASLGRLRYGIWLGRQTGLPVAMSGGEGWAQQDGRRVAEAAIGARVAAQQFGAPLRWQENDSRDTRENARNTLALLAPEGVREIVLVTSAWHMPRALREFRAAAARQPMPMRILPAPTGTGHGTISPLLRWIPSSQGAQRSFIVLHEALGLVFAPREAAPSGQK